MSDFLMSDAQSSSERPLLTIAIPTYNRAKNLDEILGLIFAQIIGEHRVEVLVSDNASTDETGSVIRQYERCGPALRSVFNAVNHGPDFNILQCYEMARGKYVWIFGDDDLILDDGISKVLDLLRKEEVDYVFIAPYVFHNSIHEIELKRRVVRTKIIEDPVEMVSYVNLYADLIFISACIINKDNISNLNHPPFSSLLGTNLIQLGWIFTCLRHFRRGAFLQLGLLAARAGNSSGGFEGARVFGANFKRAVGEMLDDESRVANKILNDHIEIWFPSNWIDFRKSERGIQGHSSILSRAFRGNWRYWSHVYPLVHAPLNTAKIWARLLRIPNRIKREYLTILGGGIE